MSEDDETTEEQVVDAEGVRQLIEDVLAPLLAADDAAIEFLGMDDETVRVKVSGNAAFGVGCTYVRTHVIEPAIREVAPQHAVDYELVVPAATRRT